MAANNLTGDEMQIRTFQELVCSPSFTVRLQQPSIYLAMVNLFFTLTAILGNSLILLALCKESSLHPPSKLLYRKLPTTDLLVGLVTQPLSATYQISSVYKHWNICRYARGVGYLTSYGLCGVSLLTMTVISVDRLLALLLGLRYRQIVTLKRTYIILTTVWVFSAVAALSYVLNQRIAFWFLYITVPVCLAISIISYTKIFLSLRYHKAQVRQQSSQPNSLNILRYRKAVYSALWVQLALVVCYAPYFIVESLTARRKALSSYLVVIRGIVVALLYFNSTLNPFLYCWKISDVRKAAKQTIRQALSCTCPCS
ncbi:histamine H2 receptor-like [Stylophora pistillata]|uniref:histamine H2 receptor-like n=1 Tax=Stylophora pistillata TaxID=50429 RepID=UPI000C03EA56|nr:histamine H2 receptor-like [Stylophora pistillata]